MCFGLQLIEFRVSSPSRHCEQSEARRGEFKTDIKLGKRGGLLNSEQEVQECDATKIIVALQLVTKKIALIIYE
jgi:hypothetical protein